MYGSGTDATRVVPTYLSPFQKRVAKSMSSCKIRPAVHQNEFTYKRTATCHHGERRGLGEIRQKMDAENLNNTSSSLVSTTRFSYMPSCVEQLISFTQLRLCMASAYRDIVIDKPWTKCGGYSAAISVVTELRNAASELLQCEQVKPLRELFKAELLTTERALVLCDAFNKHDMFNTSMSLVQLRSSIIDHMNYLSLKEDTNNNSSSSSSHDMEEDQPISSIPRVLLWAKAVARGVERRFPLFFPWAAVERLKGGIAEHFEKFVNDCVLAFEAFDFEGSRNRHVAVALVLDFVLPEDSTTGLQGKQRSSSLSAGGLCVFPFARDDAQRILLSGSSPPSCSNFMDHQATTDSIHKLKSEKCCHSISSQWHIIDNPVTADSEAAAAVAATPPAVAAAASVQCGGMSSNGTEDANATAAADDGGFNKTKIVFMRYASERGEVRYTISQYRSFCFCLLSHCTSV